MFLTVDELAELTNAKRKDRQIKALQDMRIRFARAIDGRPKVLQAEVERVMLGGPVVDRVEEQQPRFDRIHG